MEIKELYSIFCQCGCVATDSRKISGGELFIALKGENFDGNEYAEKALNSGAAYVVVTSGSVVCDKSSAYLDSDGRSRIIPVSDTLQTLQELARYHREHVLPDGKHLDIIGITGTNGKTTTKELIKTVLSAKYNVVATEGNLNNSIGVPLTLLRINGETQIAVVEMGASHPGDIRELVEIALPNYGLVTNVGKAHLLGFGSLEGVMATKGELYDYLRRTSDKVFINVDNPLLCKMASDRNLQSDPERPYSLLLPYGLEYQGASVMPSSPEHPYLRLSIPDSDGSLVLVQTSLVGSYNADNVMAAIAVGRHFGISLKEAALAIESYVPSNNRSQMMRTEKNRLIVDAYNANPTSMTAALDNFASVSAPSKVALLGDMLELGTESVAEHVAIAKKALSLGLSKVCFVGAEFGKALQIIKKEQEELCDAAMHFDSSDSLKSYLDANPLEDALVLVKGSRGTRMEKTISSL